MSIFQAIVFSASLLLASTLSAATVTTRSYEKPLESILSHYVNSLGQVDYRKLRKDPNYRESLRLLKEIPAEKMRKMRAEERKTLFINAYNLFAIKMIVDHYPIKSSFFRSFVYPRNSIQQIPDVWNQPAGVIAGRTYTLNQIEHSILRPEFKDPRIHFAIVCASKGCPSLWNHVFLPEKLDKQLDTRTRAFIRNREKVRCDGSELEVSKIFKWFREDFEYWAKKNYPASKKDPVVLFVSQYADEQLNPCLKGKNLPTDLDYLPYSWELNEQ